jgi:mRNA-degrading endonuclease RelE of RelBE toxin-antitoxin system
MILNGCRKVSRTRQHRPNAVRASTGCAGQRGDYRALYTIDYRELVVMVLAVAHRRDAYRP